MVVDAHNRHLEMPMLPLTRNDKTFVILCFCYIALMCNLDLFMRLVLVSRKSNFRCYG